MKPLLSDKIKSSEKISLVDGGKVIFSDEKKANILDKCFSSVIKNLKIEESSDTDPCLWLEISHMLF